MSKVSGNFVLSSKLIQRNSNVTTFSFLYNVADGVIKDWDEYYEGIHLSIGEDDYVEVD